MRRALTLVVPVVVALGAGLAAGRLFADDTANPPAAPAAAPAASDAAKEAKVRKLLKAQGGEELAQMTFDKMLGQFEKTPGLPPGFVEAFRKKVSVKEILDLSIPSYVKHLDESTIDAAIAFYETPEGKKLTSKLPAIQMEVIDSSAAWGQRVAREVLSELQGQKHK